MSRIGKSPIKVPSGVTVTINGSDVTVKGPKGELKRTFRPEISISQEGDEVLVKRDSDERNSRSLHGLSRTLLNNMVVGVSSGFEKNQLIRNMKIRRSHMRKAGHRSTMR